MSSGSLSKFNELNSSYKFDDPRQKLSSWISTTSGYYHNEEEKTESKDSSSSTIWQIAKFLLIRWLTVVNLVELLLLFVLLFGCSRQCYDIISDFLDFPAETSIQKLIQRSDSRDHFPGLTICNNNRFSRSSINANFKNVNLSLFGM